MNQVWSNTNNNRNILEILFKNILKSKNQIDIYETKKTNWSQIYADFSKESEIYQA